MSFPTATTAKHRYSTDYYRDSAALPNGVVRISIHTGELYRWDARRFYWDLITPS